MSSDAASALSASAASGFAKLFAGLTAPKRRSGDSHSEAGLSESRAESYSESLSDDWIDEALAPDVATISYEHALRTHARYRRSDALPDLPADSSPEIPEPSQSVRITEWVPDDSTTALTRSRKSSSITIRLNHAECEQVHARAVDAGLTVSAYLRSCIFEVETLRAQVKEALVHLSPNLVSTAQAAIAQPVERFAAPSKDWRTRLFAHWSHNRNHVDA